MARPRITSAPPLTSSHHSTPSTPRRPRPSSRTRTFGRQHNFNAIKSTPSDASSIDGKLPKTETPPEILSDLEAVDVELKDSSSLTHPRRVGAVGHVGCEGTAIALVPDIRARRDPRLDADVENNGREGNHSNKFKGRQRDGQPENNEEAERSFATPFASATSSTHPNHQLQPHNPRYSLGTSLAHTASNVRPPLIGAVASSNATAGSQGFLPESVNRPLVKTLAPARSPPPGDEATLTPRRRSAIPTPLLNIKPQINASDLFDCMPELITAPMSFEQRRARILAIMPGLKSLNDEDIPLPKPYNAAYPHPISAYASPGVNPAALYISGYDRILKKLLAEDRDTLKGGILASAVREDVLPPALTMIFTPGEGNGIPERLWTRFESIGGARLPVGAATPGPYARVEPAIGHPDPFSPYIEADPVPPRFANLHPYKWQHHGQLTPPDRSSRDYFEFPMVRRASNNDINTWRNEMSGTKSLPVPVRGVYPSESPASSSLESHWFKTEICPIWEDTGICKYGKACQYAHGTAELRALPRMAPLPTPPLDASPLIDGFFPEGTRPYTVTNRKGSLPDTAPPSRLDARRASAPPPRDLSPVGEFDENIAPSFWRDDYVVPIGAERDANIPHKRSIGSKMPDLQMGYRADFSADGPRMMAPRATRIDTEHHRLSNFPSASSLSASSSKLSTGTQSYETTTSAGWSSIEPEPACQVAAARFAVGEEISDPPHPDWRNSKSSTSASLDFSTGRSIWC